MGYGLWTLATIAFISASLTLQTALKNGFIDFSPNFQVANVLPCVQSKLSTPLYNCQYAGMWCTCYANNQGGCSVGCRPNVYQTKYNQTSCPTLSNFILAGFSLA